MLLLSSYMDLVMRPNMRTQASSTSVWLTQPEALSLDCAVKDQSCSNQATHHSLFGTVWCLFACTIAATRSACIQSTIDLHLCLDWQHRRPELACRQSETLQDICWESNFTHRWTNCTWSMETHQWNRQSRRLCLQGPFPLWIVESWSLVERSRVAEVPSTDWPKLSTIPDVGPSDKEREVSIHSKLHQKPPFIPLDRFSSFIRFRYVTAWILRFVNNCRSRDAARVLSPLSVQ